MAIAKGVSKLVGYKKETSWGVPAGASGAKLLVALPQTLILQKKVMNRTKLILRSRPLIRVTVSVA